MPAATFLSSGRWSRSATTRSRSPAARCNACLLSPLFSPPFEILPFLFFFPPLKEPLACMPMFVSIPCVDDPMLAAVNLQVSGPALRRPCREHGVSRLRLPPPYVPRPTPPTLIPPCRCHIFWGGSFFKQRGHVRLTLAFVGGHSQLRVRSQVPTMTKHNSILPFPSC